MPQVKLNKPSELLPFWQTLDGATVKLYRGNVIDVLRRLKGGSVHCIVTSPPY